jgi:hypothetical protein
VEETGFRDQESGFPQMEKQGQVIRALVNVNSEL